MKTIGKAILSPFTNFSFYGEVDGCEVIIFEERVKGEIRLIFMTPTSEEEAELVRRAVSGDPDVATRFTVTKSQKKITDARQVERLDVNAIRGELKKDQGSLF
jgi:hypothetical protein